MKIFVHIIPMSDWKICQLFGYLNKKGKHGMSIAELTYAPGTKNFILLPSTCRYMVILKSLNE